MYKVFINDKPIILTDSLSMESDFKLLHYKNIAIPEIVHKLKIGKLLGVLLYCNDLQKCWEEFKNHFKLISAAGGLVLNKNKEFLFIYRGNKWDLPKGRIEKGEGIEETAVREVKEECGVSELYLHRFLLTTYHIFFQNNQDYLKETHWFLMEAPVDEKLTPQLEEGINIAEFKNSNEAKKALQNSYGNIHLVFESYQN